MSDGRGRGSGAEPLESPVVAKTVRLLTPFVLTFGLFTMFHGTKSVGGGFQGGVVVAAGIVVVGFTFGLGQTRRWLDPGVTTGAAASGVLTFAAVALGATAFGGAYLQVDVFPVPDATVYAIELVELGIGATVAGTITAMFVLLGTAAVGGRARDGTGTRTDGGRDDGRGEG